MNSTTILRRTLLASASCLSFMSAVSAQAATVTNGGYTARDSVAFHWTELATPAKTPVPGATRVLGNHDDSFVGAISLGFNFSFFGHSYSQAYITSNGMLTFGSSTTDNINTPLGSHMSVSTMPLIAAEWDDWTSTFSGTDGVYYQTLGSAGSRSFVVEWHNTKKYDTASGSNSSPVSFEAVLYEGSNAIELRYLDVETGGSTVNPDASRGATATVGIRNTNADVNGQYLQWSHNQAALRNETAILITPVPEPETYAMLLAGLGLLGFVGSRRRASKT